MIDISRDISRLKRRLVLTKFFDCFLDSVLIGLLISGLLLAFGVSGIYSFILGGAYLFFGFIKSAKKASLSELEKKIPNLEWQLRTAADNTEKRNEVIERLNMEVAEKIGVVRFVDLLSGKRAIKRTIGIFLVGIFVFYIHLTGFNIITAVAPEDGISGITGGITSIFSDDNSKPIFANKPEAGQGSSEVEYGKKELELELKTEADKVDLSKEEELSGEPKGGKEFTGTVDAKQDSSYSEKIGSDEKAIVENFYNNLNK